MNALTPIAPKLARLIPMLSSPHDGEALAAARAIGRALEAAGVDWHELAKRLAADPEPDVVVIYRAPPTSKPRGWRAVAEFCATHGTGVLTEREAAFVSDMARRLIFGGEPTSKQADWLRALYAKVGGQMP